MAQKPLSTGSTMDTLHDWGSSLDSELGSYDYEPFLNKLKQLDDDAAARIDKLHGLGKSLNSHFSLFNLESDQSVQDHSSNLHTANIHQDHEFSVAIDPLDPRVSLNPNGPDVGPSGARLTDVEWLEKVSNLMNNDPDLRKFSNKDYKPTNQPDYYDIYGDSTKMDFLNKITDFDQIGNKKSLEDSKKDIHEEFDDPKYPEKALDVINALIKDNKTYFTELSERQKEQDDAYVHVYDEEWINGGQDIISEAQNISQNSSTATATKPIHDDTNPLTMFNPMDIETITDSPIPLTDEQFLYLKTLQRAAKIDVAKTYQNDLMIKYDLNKPATFYLLYTMYEYIQDKIQSHLTTLQSDARKRFEMYFNLRHKLITVTPPKDLKIGLDAQDPAPETKIDLSNFDDELKSALKSSNIIKIARGSLQISKKLNSEYFGSNIKMNLDDIDTDNDDDNINTMNDGSDETHSGSEGFTSDEDENNTKRPKYTGMSKAPWGAIRPTDYNNNASSSDEEEDHDDVMNETSTLNDGPDDADDMTEEDKKRFIAHYMATVGDKPILTDENMKKVLRDLSGENIVLLDDYSTADYSKMPEDEVIQRRDAFVEREITRQFKIDFNDVYAIFNTSEEEMLTFTEMVSRKMFNTKTWKLEEWVKQRYKQGYAHTNEYIKSVDLEQLSEQNIQTISDNLDSIDELSPPDADEISIDLSFTLPTHFLNDASLEEDLNSVFHKLRITSTEIGSTASTESVTTASPSQKTTQLPYVNSYFAENDFDQLLFQLSQPSNDDPYATMKSFQPTEISMYPIQQTPDSLVQDQYSPLHDETTTIVYNEMGDDLLPKIPPIGDESELSPGDLLARRMAEEERDLLLQRVSTLQEMDRQVENTRKQQFLLEMSEETLKSVTTKEEFDAFTENHDKSTDDQTDVMMSDQLLENTKKDLRELKDITIANLNHTAPHVHNDLAQGASPHDLDVKKEYLDLLYAQTGQSTHQFYPTMLKPLENCNSDSEDDVGDYNIGMLTSNEEAMETPLPIAINDDFLYYTNIAYQTGMLTESAVRNAVMLPPSRPDLQPSSAPLYHESQADLFMRNQHTRSITLSGDEIGAETDITLNVIDEQAQIAEFKYYSQQTPMSTEEQARIIFERLTGVREEPIKK